MIRKLIGLPIHLLRKLLGREKKAAAPAQARAPSPRPRPPEARATGSAGGHDHGHDHGGGHNHGHDHGGAEDRGHDHGHDHGGGNQRAAEPEDHDHGHDHGGGHDHGHAHEEVRGPDHGHDHDHAPAPAQGGRVKQVWVEETPNPNARKFVCGVQVVEKGSAIFNNAQEAANNPAAAAIFGLGGVRSVFMVKDFVSVTREPQADWDRLAPQVVEALKRSL